MEDSIGGASDDQLANSGVRASAAQIRVIPQSLDDGDDPRGQTIRGVRLVQGNVRVYFPQPCARQRRPDNL
jgi:hypothetical protein